MKRLLLLLPLLFIAGCGKYGSFTEARSACDSWRSEKGSFEMANSVHSRAVPLAIRMCINEVVISQLLGMEYPEADAGTTYIGDGTATFTNENGKVLKSRAIVKRFKY